MKIGVPLFLVFACGFATALSLVSMYGTTPEYDGQWWKVGISGVIALGASIFISGEVK